MAKPRRNPLTRWAFLLPALLTVLLNLPSLGLGYFWDDFYFLTFPGHGGPWAHLWPVPDATFYRPIPLGGYFGVLRLLDPTSGLLGHVLNLVALVAAVLLLVHLVSKLAGPRAGVFSGVIFAVSAHVSGLVAWVSGCQDLFAILFLLAAFVMRHRGKNVAAVVLACAALLSKESALAAFLALAFWDRLVGKPAPRAWVPIAAYGLVALAWMSFHPGIRHLVSGAFRSSTIGYVGIGHPEVWGLHFGRYVATLFNLPAPGLDAPWWSARETWALAALFVLIAGLVALERQARLDGSPHPLSLARLGAIAALFTVPGLLMPTLLIRHWAPYFAALPSIGFALFFGPLLARQSRPIVWLALSTFLLLGAWTRGETAGNEWVLSETAMVDASHAVTTVRASFRKVLPAISHGSQVVASVGTRGIRGIYGALIDGQALGLWYGDPSIQTITTMQYRRGAGDLILLRVTDDLDLILIDPDTQAVRGTLAGLPPLAQVGPPLRNFARAAAAEGETDRGIRILEGLNRIEEGALSASQHRLMAAMLIAGGRRAQADSILRATPAVPRDASFLLVYRFQSEPSRSEALDEATFEAFGLSIRDPDTIRWMMRSFRTDGSLAQAAWFADKLMALKPGDAEAAGMLAEVARARIKPDRAPALRSGVGS